MEIARIVIAGLIVLEDVPDLRAGVALVGVRDRTLEPGQDIMPSAPGGGSRGASVKDVEETVRRVTGMESQAE